MINNDWAFKTGIHTSAPPNVVHMQTDASWPGGNKKNPLTRLLVAANTSSYKACDARQVVRSSTTVK